MLRTDKIDPILNQQTLAIICPIYNLHKVHLYIIEVFLFLSFERKFDLFFSALRLGLLGDRFWHLSLLLALF